MVQQTYKYWNLSSFNTTVTIVDPLNIQTAGKLLKWDHVISTRFLPFNLLFQITKTENISTHVKTVRVSLEYSIICVQDSEKNLSSD